jgi:hypothetical protein
MATMTRDANESVAREARLRRFTWRVFLAILAVTTIALILAVAGPGRDLYEWIDERLNPPEAGSFVALL